MTTYSFTLSAFGDEIAPDPASQLSLMRDLKIGYLELRDAWGKNVLTLTDEEAQSLKQLCSEKGIQISAIGSPIGKSPLLDPIEGEYAKLRRIMQIAGIVGTNSIRIFSYYPPDTSTNVEYDRYIEEVISRLRSLVELAAAEDCVLLMENEKGIIGDTIDRCRAILVGVSHPRLKFVWDPANFVQVGEERPTKEGWPVLANYLAHVHIKDVRSEDGSVRAAGEGDGQIEMLLQMMKNSGYQGYLALEPHLVTAGKSGGFSGADGMTRAAQALRRLMAEAECVEQSPSWV